MNLSQNSRDNNSHLVLPGPHCLFLEERNPRPPATERRRFNLKLAPICRIPLIVRNIQVGVFLASAVASRFQSWDSELVGIVPCQPEWDQDIVLPGGRSRVQLTVT